MTINNFVRPSIRKMRAYVGRKIENGTKDRVLVDPLEPKVLVLCRKMIRDPKSKLLFAPTSNKRIIVNDEQKIRIIIQNETVKISDESGQVNIDLCPHNAKSIAQVFDAHIESEGNTNEQIIRSGIEKSFFTIYNYHTQQ